MSIQDILFEPFKIKSVEPISFSTQEQRKEWIEAVHHNIFFLKSEQILIDLLTDSGTGAMSHQQWAAMLSADESYAGSSSFLALEKTVQALTGMQYILPVHQGRAAEALLFSAILKEGDLVLSNGLFDTTLANVQAQKAKGQNIPIEEANDPFNQHSFKGNIDLIKLEEILKKEGSKIPCVVMTLTNNVGGGQPVSMDNLQKAAKIIHSHKKMLIIDACRFAENSYFIKQREISSSIQQMSCHEIARACFEFADAITFSGKKDGLVNIGGLLCVRNYELSEELKTRMVVVEGFPTYGGMAGYSLAAMNQGLQEVLDEKYLEYRLRTVSWMVERLHHAGIPVLLPAGGHAVYIESSKFLPHIKREHFPGIALSSDLYIRGGIRACELGSVAFGYRDENGKDVLPPLDLVRLALPRRVYTEAHCGYVVECIKESFLNRDKFHGYEFLEEAKIMRHFRSKFKPLST